MPPTVKKPKKAKREKPDGVRVGAIFVPIYKIRDGRFQIAYRIGGKRKIETYKTRDAAKGGAEAAATTLNNSGAEGFVFTAADRAIYAHAALEVEKYGVGVMDAIMEWSAARQQVGRHGIAKLISLGMQAIAQSEKTTGKVLDELMISKRAAQYNPKYIKGLDDDLAEFASGNPGNIGNIRAGEIEAWLNSLDVGARRRNNIRAEIVTLFRFAKDRGYLAESRRTEAEKVPRISDRRGGSVSVYTPDDFKKLLDALCRERGPRLPGGDPRPARIEWLPWIAIGGFAGIRTEEICPPPGTNKDCLRWEDFNWTKRYITVRPEVAKTAEKRHVPICDALFAWLRPFHAATGPVCIHRRPDRITAWMAKASGVKWKVNALRHSYGTYRTAVVKNLGEVSLEMGNSIPMIRRHYYEARQEEEGKAWFEVWPDWPDNVIQTTFNLAS